MAGVGVQVQKALPPPSDVLAPQLSVVNERECSSGLGSYKSTGTRPSSFRVTPGVKSHRSESRTGVVTRLTRQTGLKNKREIEEILQDKLWMESVKYIPEAQHSRPSTAGSSLARQSLLKNIQTTMNTNVNQTPKSAFADQCHLEHLGINLEVKRSAADYLLVNKKQPRSHPVSPKQVKGTQHLRRYVTSASNLRKQREEAEPLQRISTMTDESYLKHLADKKEHERLKAEAETRSLNPMLSPAVMDALFVEFSKFCERLKQRAEACGHTEDARAVDTEETKRVLLDRFLTHHLTMAEDTDGAENVHIHNHEEERRELRQHRPRPRTAPAKKAQSRLAHPMLMHARQKSQNLENLLSRQHTHDTCHAKLVEEETKLAKLQTDDPSEEDRAEMENIELEMQRLKCKMGEMIAQPTGQCRKTAESPRVRCTRVVETVNREAKEAFYNMMEQHTVGHFQTLQRQQARHQEKSRLLFNRSSSAMRRRIVDMRSKRVDQNAASHSACLLFMPPPTEVRVLS